MSGELKQVTSVEEVKVGMKVVVKGCQVCGAALCWGIILGQTGDRCPLCGNEGHRVQACDQMPGDCKVCHCSGTLYRVLDDEVTEVSRQVVRKKERVR